MEIALRAPAPPPPPSARSPHRGLTPAEVAGLHDELLAYHQEFTPFFRRTEQRHWALKYLEGQRLLLERKSIEPMADALTGGNVQAMQQFISLGAWEDEAVLTKHQQLVAEGLGDAATGGLIVDGCDFPKQGTHSVGAARQYCGALGKVANGQASVVACYASARGSTLVDRRLYVHEDWFTEDYRVRRTRCGVPAGLPFQTRTALAWAMIAGLRERGVLPFRWVTGDEGFGNTPVLLDQIAAVGRAYFMEVPHNVRVWAARPPTAVPDATGKKGHPVTRVRLAPGVPAPVRVDARAAALPASAWQAAQIQDGSKGPLVAAIARVRAVAARDGLPGPDVRLVLRRAPAAAREVQAYRCNAPTGTAPATLVGRLGRRWPVGSAREAATDELGLDHGAVRGWRGGHHPVAMTLLARHFRASGAAAAQRDAPRPAARRAGEARLHPRGAAAHRHLRQDAACAKSRCKTGWV